MKTNYDGLYRKLRGGLFLSSMMDITDGSFCSERGKGCIMVQLGAYLAEPPAYGRQRYFLPSNPEECVRFLAEECAKSKTSPDTFTCLNLATPKLEWGLEAAECFRKAGGNLVELNVHGGYQRYLRQGKLRAMVLPENRNELFSWIQAFTGLEIPLIVKFREGVIEDYSPVLDRMTDFNLFGVHFNVRDEKSGKPDFGFVQKVKSQFPFFFLASGYVRSALDVKRLFEAGANMVGISEPTIEDQNYIYRISKDLRALHS